MTPLVIFDCDGVLVDSEPISAEVLGRVLTDCGLQTSAEEADRQFKGQILREVVRIAEEQLGRALPTDFIERFERERLAQFKARLQPIAGAADAVRAVSAAGIGVCVASQGRLEKTEMTLGLTGLRGLFGEHALFSAYSVARGKPFPDLFLLAAAAMGTEPGDTVVVEDTPIGARAGVAAGMRVLGLAAASDATALRDVGAEPFQSLAEVPALLGIAARDH
ncbi:MAG: HAD family hydrolase [Solirubrobacteraceae bacterium]